jgi:hypothetical protein
MTSPDLVPSHSPGAGRCRLSRPACGPGPWHPALDGTANGGKSWTLVTATDSNIDEGDVACLSVSVCVATTDNGLWVTQNDGGLTG